MCSTRRCRVCRNAMKGSPLRLLRPLNAERSTRRCASCFGRDRRIGHRLPGIRRAMTSVALMLCSLGLALVTPLTLAPVTRAVNADDLPPPASETVVGSDGVCACHVARAFPRFGPVPRNVRLLIDGDRVDPSTAIRSRTLPAEPGVQGPGPTEVVPLEVEPVGTSGLYWGSFGPKIEPRASYFVSALTRDPDSDGDRVPVGSYDVTDDVDTTPPKIEDLRMEPSPRVTPDDCHRWVLYFHYKRATDDFNAKWLPMRVTLEQGDRKWETLVRLDAYAVTQLNFISYDQQMIPCPGVNKDLSDLGFYGRVKVTATLYDLAGNSAPPETFEVDFGPDPNATGGCSVARGAGSPGSHPPALGWLLVGLASLLGSRCRAPRASRQT